MELFQLRLYPQRHVFNCKVFFFGMNFCAHNNDAEFDESLYQMSDGRIVLAEKGLEIGDLPIDSQEINGATNSSLDFSNVVGMTWIDDGFTIVFNDQGSLTQQPVKWGDRGPVLSGKSRAIKDKQVATLEERLGVDIDLDDRIGNQVSEDAEVKDNEYDQAAGGADPTRAPAGEWSLL